MSSRYTPEDAEVAVRLEDALGKIGLACDLVTRHSTKCLGLPGPECADDCVLGLVHGGYADLSRALATIRERAGTCETCGQSWCGLARHLIAIAPGQCWWTAGEHAHARDACWGSPACRDARFPPVGERASSAASLPGEARPGSREDVEAQLGAKLVPPGSEGEATAQCSACGRKTWDPCEVGASCGMPQPNGTACAGRFSSTHPGTEPGKAAEKEGT